MIQSCCASRAAHFDPDSSSIDFELRLIDVSNQNLTALPPLVVENSDKVEHLILDGNNFTEYFLNTTFSNLRTLSLNTNRIRDVGFLLRLVAKKCPKLSFLSLIGNPGWPNQFQVTDVRLYKNYTCAVARLLPRLEFLDSFQLSTKKLLTSTCRIS
uniref:Leucine-rich repeat-containing protein 51 n=1 Tax=Steinernema glaseri TaxID=37863 RepID=A0A1I7ZKG3_9BILA